MPPGPLRFLNRAKTRTLSASLGNALN